MELLSPERTRELLYQAVQYCSHSFAFQGCGSRTRAKHRAGTGHALTVLLPEQYRVAWPIADSNERESNTLAEPEKDVAGAPFCSASHVSNCATCATPVSELFKFIQRIFRYKTARRRTHSVISFVHDPEQQDSVSECATARLANHCNLRNDPRFLWEAVESFKFRSRSSAQPVDELGPWKQAGLNTRQDPLAGCRHSVPRKEPPLPNHLCKLRA